MRRRVPFVRYFSKSSRKHSQPRRLRLESLEDRVVKDAGMAGALWNLDGVFHADSDGATEYLAHVYDGNGQLSLDDPGRPSFDPSRRQAFDPVDAGPDNQLDASPYDADPNAVADLPELPLPTPDPLEQPASDLDEAALNPQPLPPRDWNVDDQSPFVNELDWVFLNPQPLPPRVFDVSDGIFADLDQVELNPQPLPPRVLDVNHGIFADLDQVELNPQPLPPRVWDVDDANFFADELAWVELNPQPLPPKELAVDNVFGDFDWAMLNPQPLPPRVFADADVLAYLQPQVQPKLYDVEIQSQLSTANVAHSVATSLMKHMSSTTSATLHNIFP